MSKKQALTHRSYEVEIVIFGFSAIFLIVALLQYPDLDPFCWMMPAGIISVYVTHRLTSDRTDSKIAKPVNSTENTLSWKKIVLGLSIYVVMYAMYTLTTGLLRGNIENFNEWNTLPIAIVFLFFAQIAVKRLEKSWKPENK